jgi:hypothetical protein
MNWTALNNASASHLRLSEVTTFVPLFLSLWQVRLATYQNQLSFCKYPLRNLQ